MELCLGTRFDILRGSSYRAVAEGEILNKEQI